MGDVSVISRGGREDIFGAVALRAGSGRVAVSVFSRRGFESATYGELAEGSLSLARLVDRRASSAILLHGGDAIRIAMAILAASYLSLPLILCDGGASSSAIGSVLALRRDIFALSDAPLRGAMDFSELSAEMGCTAPMPLGGVRRGGETTLSFFSGEGLESHGEVGLIHSARRLAEMWGGCGGVWLTDHSPSTTVGVVCALLTCLLSGARAVFVDSADQLEHCARAARPTRLLCRSVTAWRAVELLERDERGALAMPTPFKPKRHNVLDLLPASTRLAGRRRLLARRLLRLGGALRSVCVTDDDPRLADRLADFGIPTHALLSVRCCPFAGLKSFVTDPTSWRPPEGLYADVCSVGKGGVGRITLSGSGTAIPDPAPKWLCESPHSFRLDRTDGLSLVTDLQGYILPNGNFRLKKAAHADFFCKNPCNSTKNIL